MNRSIALASSAFCMAVQVAAISAPAVAAGQDALTVASPLVVPQTRQMSALTIRPDGSIAAPEGRNLTLTVDGKVVDAQPGSYKGAIVLTVTDNIPLRPMLGGDPYAVSAALYVDGGVVAARSVLAATGGARITDSEADGIRLNAAERGFNGIIITGKSDYVLNKPDIVLSSDGGDDSIGYGAAISIGGDARVTINAPRIRTTGVIRTGIFIDGQSDVTVNDADIETFGGTLPADYKFSILPGQMMEVPYGLGISGNTRSTNIQGTATVRYNRARIRAHGWGALATDGAGPAHLFVKDSRIEVLDSGYAIYANGESKDVVDNSVLTAPDYGLIIGGPGSATFTNGSRVSSGKYGVMMHQGSGGGTLLIDKGSRFDTKLTGIVVKGRGTTIIIDQAQFAAANGILLQTMENDDPIMRDMMRAGPPPQGDPRDVGTPAEPAPGTGGPVYSGDTLATIRNTALQGDVMHALPGKALSLTLEDARLTGRISTATARPASGKEPTRETFKEVSNVVNTIGQADASQKLAVTLNGASQWEVTGASWLNGLTIGKGAQLVAPAGKVVKMTVDGRNVRLRPGSYSGAILIDIQ